MTTQKELKEAYRRECKVRYYILVLAYATDLAVKCYLLYKVGGVVLAYFGSAVDTAAKIYMLKNMKMRGKSKYIKRTRKRK